VRPEGRGGARAALRGRLCGWVEARERPPRPCLARRLGFVVCGTGPITQAWAGGSGRGAAGGAGCAVLGPGLGPGGWGGQGQGGRGPGKGPSSLLAGAGSAQPRAAGGIRAQIWARLSPPAIPSTRRRRRFRRPAAPPPTPPGVRSRIAVPRPVAGMASEGVYVMEWVDGASVAAFMRRPGPVNSEVGGQPPRP
jgi:hypothetical protein